MQVLRMSGMDELLCTLTSHQAPLKLQWFVGHVGYIVLSVFRSSTCRLIGQAMDMQP